MPYWIHGRDAETGEPTEPMFSEAQSEEAARAEATAQGMIVEWVKPHVEEETTGEPRSILLPQQEPDPASDSQGSAHELTAEQAKVISSLASYMWAFGVLVLMAMGGLHLAKRSWGPLEITEGILGLIMGGLVWNAAQKLRETARAPGNEIRRLIEALGSLKWLFAIQAWLLALGLILGGLAKAMPFFVGRW